jgi:hypothetical protein
MKQDDPSNSQLSLRFGKPGGSGACLYSCLVRLLLAGYRWRVKSIESRNRQLENLVQRRTSDLEKRTRDIEACMKQMNGSSAM